MSYSLAQFVSEINSLGTETVYPYASLSGHSTSSCKLVSVDSNSGAIKFTRNGGAQVEKISCANVSKLVEALATNKAVEMNSLFGGSGNARSVLEAFVVHTPHVFLCKIDGKKHIYYSHDKSHPSGQIEIDTSPNVPVYSGLAAVRKTDDLGLVVGMQSEDSTYGVVTIVDDDDYSYQVLCVNDSKHSKGIRTISKILVKEWIGAVTSDPSKNASMIRGDLCGRSDIDKFEYGNEGVLIKLAKMATGQAPHTMVDVSEYWKRRLGRSERPMRQSSDLLTVALKLFAERRAKEKPGYKGWESYDAWTRRVREEFSKVNEGMIDDKFNYKDFIQEFSLDDQPVNAYFSKHSLDEQKAVLQFLKEQKDSPRAASWYIEEKNRPQVNGEIVDGIGAPMALYFMSELHPEEFVAWSKPIWTGLCNVGLCNGSSPKKVTIENYEECRSKQQQIVARMKELDIGKASDDSSAPDYRTANEFLWWVSKDENKDLIKEKIMSKAMKKPTTKKNEEGKATISSLLKNKEDSLMTMLIAGLLTKPLAILAGVSGTGKSRMVRHLAYKTCLDEDLKPSDESAPGNFKMVQVKPSWHDSADLLGYRSAVNEKHEYVSTDFVKFVLKAHAYPNTPFFVCLDEMNLAPVEHYFAEFLSACESIRKIDGKNEWTSDPIVAATDFDNDVLNLGGDVLFESADAALDAALKKTKARIEKEGLFIPRNLFVVGTVNMDDSTGGFSRKVLDRAMTIVMNEVNLEDLKKEDKDLTLSDDNLFTTAEIAKFINRADFDKDMLENGFIEQLEDIRLKLAKTPFALAYRFARETCMYKKALLSILDAAEVVKKSDGTIKKDAAGATIDADRACGDIALDHMILMKLLPRLTGTKEKREEVIKNINDFLDTLIKEKLVSKETLKDMVDRAKDNGGYLSFWP